MYCPPTVLAISAHDPSGGAGIQADIETIAALGCRPVTLITALTAQNTRRFTALRPQQAEDLLEQAQRLFEDTEVAAVKIGAIGDVRLFEPIRHILSMAGSIPVVLDPVLCSTTGGVFVDPPARRALVEQLCSRCTLITPNREEALLLSGAPDPAAAAALLLTAGARSVLITDLHPEEQDFLTHCCYQGKKQEIYRCQRLPGQYHGSGCTLAAAIAAALARKEDLAAAVGEGLDYTWHTLEQAPHRTGAFHEAFNEAFNETRAQADRKRPQRPQTMVEKS